MHSADSRLIEKPASLEAPGPRGGAVLMLVGLAMAYCVFLVTFGRFTGVDEIAFKAAGREWAESGRFAAPELEGFLALDPPAERVWFVHMPLYTFAFGLFIELFGFGAGTSILFDALIHAALVFLTFALSLNSGARTNVRAAALSAVLVLPIAGWGRADELAMCFGIAALLTIRSSRIGAGALLGCSGATSLVAAGVFGFLAIALSTEPRHGNLRNHVVLTGVSIATMVSLLTPLLLLRPDAVRQFIHHAAQQVPSWSYGIRFTFTYGRSFVVLLCAAALLLLSAALRGRPAWHHAQRFAALFAATLLLIVAFPAKYYYLWFLGPVAISFAIAAVAEGLVRRAAVAAACMAYLMVVANESRSFIIAATLPPDQRLAPNLRRIQQIVEPGSTVLASEFWSSLANRVEYRSLVHGNPDYRGVDYVILTSNGAGAPGRVQGLTPRQAAELRSFEVVHDNLPRKAPRVFGLPLSNSAWGFGTRIYRRIGSRAPEARLR